MVIAYARYDAREKLFKPILHSNDILSVYYKNWYCVRGALSYITRILFDLVTALYLVIPHKIHL